MYHIFIVNNPGNNIGDEAALKGIVYGLKNINSNIEISLSNTGIVNLESIQDKIKKIFDETKILNRKKYISLFAKAFLFKIGVYHTQNDEYYFLKTIKKSDLILIAPGGCGISRMNKKGYIRLGFWILLSKLFNKKIYLYAPSMGPFGNNFLYGYITKLIINSVDAVTLRDHTSYNNLKKLNENFNKELIVTSDSALQIPIDKNVYTKIKKEIHFEKIKVAITPIELSWHSDFKKNKIINFKIKNEIVKVINYVLRTFTESEVILIPHLYGAQNDLVLCNEILKIVNSNRVKVEIPESAESALNNYENYDLCIGFRHHAAVFALRMGIPSICIAYEHKAIGFMESIKMGDYVLDINDFNAEKIMSKIKDIINNYNAIKEIIIKNIKHLEEKSLYNSKIAIALMEKGKN
ncbi:polysaccharide pyruvyl transferase family protein [Thermoanaerobacterium thermosaccharolyticum]|uniref:polysaccharide pyruvyl transferase family protein n=1 Tax=Thermoanaerobacterium thermosaccharolyticum TaxID=1517 RepID=UPI003D2ABB74